MIPRIKDSVRVRQEEFGALVFTNRTPILALNKDASEIWVLCNGQRTVRDIANEIATEPADVEELELSVKQFVFACVELGLIEVDTLES